MLRRVPERRVQTAVAEGPVAVIDVGSNSIRLVVYERLSRAPAVLHNEKVSCGLGRSLFGTGRLDRGGVACAFANLPRFLALCSGMGVSQLNVVATAAVREASDGRAFAEEIAKRCGIRMQVLSGDEEARLSAFGVIAGNPGAHGVAGDLGGSSLEMIALDRGKPGRSATLALGPLQLAEESGGDVEAAAKVAKNRFEAPAWLSGRKGETFFAVGGAWRALAKFHMARTGYPLPVIHNFEMDLEEARETISLATRIDPETKVPGVAKARMRGLPYAAILLKRLIAVMEPSGIVFSAFGLREGCLYELLPEAMRAEDPLIAACRDLARRTEGSGLSGETLLGWTAPLFPEETVEQKRLRFAACLLCDIAKRDHPDFRAVQAFERSLFVPAFGIGHKDRVFLGLALFARHKGDIQSPLTRRVRGLVGAKERERAVVLGRALRLAHTVAGGVEDLLARTKLELTRKTLALRLNAGAESLDGEAVGKALTPVAEILGRRPEVLRKV